MLIFVNGCFIGRNDNGYAPFRFDITDFLAVGEKNCIVARVDASFGDGWFYEGAGIYRHVWLTKTDALHLGQWESYVRCASVKVDPLRSSLDTRTVANEGKQAENAAVGWQILDPAGNTVATAEAPAQQIAANGAASFQTTANLDHTALWSSFAESLYRHRHRQSNGKARDAERISFGVRTVDLMPIKDFS